MHQEGMKKASHNRFFLLLSTTLTCDLVPFFSASFNIAAFAMSSSVVSKRTRDDVDSEADVCSVAKVTRTSETHPAHPLYILDHLVKKVLPESCRNEAVKAFYKAQLEHPDAAMEECKSILANWVLDMWDNGALLKYDK